jgi:hypothetical protein
MTLSERIRVEAREIGIVTSYFLICFLFFLTLKKLLLEEYDVRVSVVGTALIGALVMAKVVILLDKTPLGNAFGSRLWSRTLWRSLLYAAIAFLVTAAERLFDAYRQPDGLSSALHELWAERDVHHFLAMNLAVTVSLLVYNAFIEIEQEMGKGSLRRLFFRRRGEPGSSTPID